MEKTLELIGDKLYTFEYETNYLKSTIRDFRIMQKFNPELGALNLGNLFAAPQAAPANPMAGGYESSVTVFDGDAAYDTVAEVYAFISATAGVKARIWEKTCDYREQMCWGSGVYGTINNQGYGWFAMIDLTTAFDVGIVTLAIESRDRHVYRVAKEFNDSDAHTADFTTLITATPTNNQTRMIAIPQTNKIALPGSRMVIDYRTISVGTEDGGGFSFPVTRKTI